MVKLKTTIVIPEIYQQIIDELYEMGLNIRQIRRTHLQDHDEFIEMPILEKAFEERDWAGTDIRYYFFEIANCLEYNSPKEDVDNHLKEIKSKDPRWFECSACLNAAVVKDYRKDEYGYEEIMTCSDCGKLTDKAFWGKVKLKN